MSGQLLWPDWTRRDFQGRRGICPKREGIFFSFMKRMKDAPHYCSVGPNSMVAVGDDCA